LLTQHHVEGILFARPSTEPDSRHLIDLLREGMQIVTTAYHLPDHGLTVVDVDNVDGGQQATRCLIHGGHRRIAMITGPASWRSVGERTSGYRLALEEAGISFDPALVVEGDWSYASGHQAVSELIGRGQTFSGLFAQNDQMAIGALRGLREAQIKVPAEVSVVGYDDIPVAEFSDPPLTTIRQPMREVGAVATRLLIQAIEQPKITHGEVLLKTELILRESSR
jgi:DNA-binding LacI/PurR family transcriptional regulator